MALAVTINSTTMNQSEIVLNFSVVASGNYTTGGDTLNFYSATYPPGGPNLPATKVPREVVIQSAATAGVSGYIYQYRPGTDPSNGLMEVLQVGASASAPLAQIPGSPTAYPAGVTGDTIIGKAYFTKEI